jgi:maleate cis-trans isomerase
VAEGENSRQQRLSKSVFSQKYVSPNISQTRLDIENRSSEHLHDMQENNISEYRSDPMVEDGVIVVGCFASSLSLNSHLLLSVPSREKIE